MNYTYSQVFEASVKYFNGDEFAAKVFVDKYALQNLNGEYLELTPEHMHVRLSKELARIEQKYSNPISEETIFSLIDKFKYIVPQGSPMSGIGNNYQLQSISNCFVIEGVHSDKLDSYGGIMLADQELAQIMKRRGGVGLDISGIRPKGMLTNNSAKTTDGIAVFMERFSNTCREVAQNGRRGAEMQTISVNHPEIETFINIKKDLKKVTGANISIKLNNEFMQAVKNDEEYTLRWPVDVSVENAKFTKKVKAKDIWNQIIDSAWTSAEPGLLFWDNVQENTPSDIYKEEGFASISSNPCFSGDTLIAVADGRHAVTIKQLSEENKDVPVYSIDKKGKVSIKIGRHPRITGYNKKLLRITLDDGSYFDVTPDHKCLLKDGSTVLAKDLKNTDSLPSFKNCNFELNSQILNQECNVKNTDELYIKRTCEICSSEFEVDYSYREKCFCSEKCVDTYLSNKNNKHTLDIDCILVNSIKEITGEHTVYNITVDENHTLAVVTKFDRNDVSKNNQTGVFVYQCGEIVLSKFDACRLLCLNLSSYVEAPFTSEAKFNYNLFKEHVIIAQRLMDDIIDIEIEQIDKILLKVENDPEPLEAKLVEINLWKKIKQANITGRRTGLGITALGDCLAMLGIKYGSEESIQITYNIYHTLGIGAHTSSCILAKERGAFSIFSYEKEKNHKYLNSIFNDCDESIRDMWATTGRRNIALTTTAPTGSVSALTQTSSGIEPVFLLSYTRRKKHNPSDKTARVDFVDALGDSWQEFTVYHHGVKKWMEITGETDIAKSPYFGSTSNEIDWEASVDLQAAAQQSIDHSISKTCNLPQSASKELVSNVYMRAWEKGCKGFTVYRDKCRDGVLLSSDTVINQNNRPIEIPDIMAPKRPVELICDIKKVKIKGEAWTIFVGLLNNKPYEVFGGLSKYVDIPNRYKLGKIVKNGKIDGVSIYNVKIGEGDDQMIIKDIANVFENANFGAFTRTISLALRHGTPIQYVVEQLQKDKHSDVTSFTTVIARVLKNYIVDGTKSTAINKCPECGKENSFIYQEKCLKCSNCNWSKC
jgi:ribonucleotide reductase alpha subunit